ncbi:LpxI family protein [Pseudaestuariivita atlantica]|uniref:Phosphatidate cytidylyltransferase n=1 Tax=Pseudaestuariivita atlantica TaxID=1317121 RepID=A0A0L1JMN1_9RHOB|nr:UDP-2,3-diacylglucosamine diphosphatase LpxI [Pseudaestuariivita atlantica]KNG93009.1 hypothetical protein ATO11_13875 [Pseudaestuariivita atlantica]
MSVPIAILAGTGALPVALAEAQPDALCLAFDTPDARIADRAEPHRLEKLGAAFDRLRAAGVGDVVLAGSIKPRLDPAALDPLMQAEAPALLAALAQGDDAVLRAVIALIERQGFRVRGAHEVAGGLTLAAGAASVAEPDPVARNDIARARAILAALGPLDVGQAAVVAQGRCLGIETLQGTEALLSFVAATDPARRPQAPGVLVKAPKPGQDLRVDMPAIGPDTVHQARAAGLAGIAVTAGQTLVLDRARLDAALTETGLFLWADAP